MTDEQYRRDAEARHDAIAGMIEDDMLANPVEPQPPKFQPRDIKVLVRRLRAVATEISAWDSDIGCPYGDWSDLMDEAADAIQELDDDAIFNAPR